jgi:DNA polymerase gamma 1
MFHKLLTKDGEAANVGSPLTKTFLNYAWYGMLMSPGDDAGRALDSNARHSCWISTCDRLMKQMYSMAAGRARYGYGRW